MKLKYWLMYFIAVNSFLAAYVSCARKSQLEKKVDALDHLVRSEVYLLNEKIETDRVERNELLKTLNETLEFLKDSQGDRADGAQIGINVERRQSDLKTLFRNVEQNRKDIGRLAKSASRTRRGLADEKKARKADSNATLTHLIQIGKTLNELSSQQTDLVIKQGDIVNNINEMSTRIDDLRVSSHMFSSDIKTVDSTTQKLSRQVNDISQREKEVRENVAANFHCDNNLDLNASLQKHFTSMEDSMNDINNRINVLQNTSVGSRVKSETLSRGIRKIVNATQSLVLLVNDISQDVQEANKDVGSEQFCDNQMDLDACLQKHFRSQGNYLSYIQLLITNVVLVGGDGPYEGRVQINFQGRIGTICDDGWDDNDATVVCRMLGYTGGTALHGPRSQGGHQFGTGYGDILFEDFGCAGSEKSLFSCGHSALGMHDCSHTEDAGVRCG